ncbi:MAG: hypothetical protein J6X18_09315 [Bacteroidales bacterium]|nr:hypothetical protein [Bacteroidales bacterium]
MKRILFVFAILLPLSVFSQKYYSELSEVKFVYGRDTSIIEHKFITIEFVDDGKTIEIRNLSTDAIESYEVLYDENFATRDGVGKINAIAKDTRQDVVFVIDNNGLQPFVSVCRYSGGLVKKLLKETCYYMK